MSAREHIVEQFEMSQMAKNGVYLFSTDKKLEDDLNKRIISDAVKNVFKTKGVSLSEKANITRENRDKLVITDKEKENTFIVRKKDEKLNIYDGGVNKYTKIELPKIVIIRTETGRRVKQPKIREEVMVPPKPEEWIGINGRKIAKIPEEKRITVMKGSLKSDIRESLDLLQGDISTAKKLDAIYYLEMAVGGIFFGSAIIFYNALGPMAIPMIILGLGVFFTSFAAKRKISRIREAHGI